MASGELPPQHHTYSIYETRGNVGDFRFCMLRKMLAPETDINRNDHRVMAIKYAVRRACGSPARWYGLENSAIIIEYVPLFARMRPAVKLVRTQVPLEILIEEAEDMEVDIFSDDLVNGNEAGKDMNVDPTELLESVADTPEQQQLDGLESEQLNDANYSRLQKSTTSVPHFLVVGGPLCIAVKLSATNDAAREPRAYRGSRPRHPSGSRSESTDPHTSRSNNCPSAR